jgi:eukaryotic-like serine/threonine-protein kinase
MFPQIFGKYVLERELAAGGMARVFLATLRGAGGFEKRLVVKQIRPELASDQSFIQRFVAEAKTTVELSHANIVPVYELGAEQGVYYIAMELCSGLSLAELLRGGPVSPAEGAYIGVEICRALDYAHRKAGIVHRDVTPRNVMIDAEGMVKVIDFGIASPASGGVSDALFGSPGHMAPEQLRPGPLTPAADVFAVAVLLIEAWTGAAPFRRESFAASAEALREPPPPLGRTDSRLVALEPLIASALALAPEQRPQTAEELARPLREFLRQDDLGDLARRLGERVGERLSRGPAAPPGQSIGAAGGELAAETPAARSAELPTRTFAARPALLEWTAKIESMPPEAASSPGPAAAASIESGVSAPSDAARESGPGGGRRAPRQHVAALAVAAALLVGIGGAWLRAPAPRGAMPALDEPARRAPSSIVTTSVATSGLATSGLATSGLATSGAGSVAVAPASSASATTASAPQPRDAALAPDQVSAAHEGTAMPRPVPVVAKHTPAHSAAARVETAGAPRAPGSALSAHVQLTAEPSAWVEIDALRVGRTPLSALPLSPGRHAIRFENPLLGERLDAVVTLEPRGTARVHADFTSASPQVYVR